MQYVYKGFHANGCCRTGSSAAILNAEWEFQEWRFLGEQENENGAAAGEEEHAHHGGGAAVQGRRGSPEMHAGKISRHHFSANQLPHRYLPLSLSIHLMISILSINSGINSYYFHIFL